MLMSRRLLNICCAVKFKPACCGINIYITAEKTSKFLILSVNIVGNVGFNSQIMLASY